MAAQFARSLPVLRLLPPSERLHITGRQACIHSKVIQQPVRIQPGHVPAIPLLSLGVDTIRQQPDLTHRESLSLEGDRFRREFELALKRRSVGSDRAPEISWGRRSLL